MSYENPGNTTLIKTDPIRLEQLLTSLLSNAVIYAFEGEVKFGFKVNPDSISLYVKDSGAGITEKDQASIVERFVKPESDNFEVLQQGTGIGFSIEKKC